MSIRNFIKANLVLLLILAAASVLRFYKLDQVPVSLFGDELDVGYHAYSILKTGRDYYGNFMPLHFHSFAEWRTPLYLYSTVPTVALFGISPLGVRLPAAIFGVIGIWVFYKLVELIRKDYLKIQGRMLEVLAALFLTISPWHIQYSRAAFEVTELLFFAMLGFYFFLKSMGPKVEKTKKGRWLWISLACFAITPSIYSTAKLFIPVILVVIFILWAKDALQVSKKYLLAGVLVFFIVGAPVANSTLFGGGVQRFGYISIFSDPTIEQEVGVSRELEAHVRGETGAGLNPTIKERLFNNKFTFWGSRIANNYLTSLSSGFLFANGDLNPRHSIGGMGMFYKIEILALVAGIIFFFSANLSRKIKLLFLSWVLVGILPAALTRDGGDHATRLILILPPLVFLNSYGIYALLNYLKKLPKVFFGLTYGLGLLILFVGYLNFYWVHNPWQSERWWHYGWKEAVQSIKAEENDFDKIIISTADEPPWIFFAAHYEYPPAQWQDRFPLDNKVVLNNFGDVSHIDKFYFGSPEVHDVYEWGKVIGNKTLYLASAKEVGPNLVREPERIPSDLVLIKAIAFPSGEPAFYLFTGKAAE